MAFDKIFQGTPSGKVAAPGSPQSPSLGVDTDGTVLYISAGDGWQPLGGGGGGAVSGSGTVGYVPKLATTTSVANSAIDDSITTAATVTVSKAFNVTGNTELKANLKVDGTLQVVGKVTGALACKYFKS